MCFDAQTSLSTFFIGAGFSLLLIYRGNPKYKRENLQFGIFLIFISLFQFMDFLFWIDLKNAKEINHWVTIFGSIFNLGQPLILFLIKIAVSRPKVIDPIIALINIIYAEYLSVFYYRFLKSSSSSIQTRVEKGRLLWPWLKPWSSQGHFLYLFVIACNIFYLSDFNYSMVFFAFGSLFLWASYSFFGYHVGEMWCFFSAFLPLILLLFSYS